MLTIQDWMPLHVETVSCLITGEGVCFGVLCVGIIGVQIGVLCILIGTLSRTKSLRYDMLVCLVMLQ